MSSVNTDLNAVHAGPSQQVPNTQHSILGCGASSDWTMTVDEDGCDGTSVTMESVDTNSVI